MSFREFDSQLMAFENSAVERRAIFVALQNHHLIDTTGDLIEITPKGRDYLEWRRPLPPLTGKNGTAAALTPTDPP